MKTTGLEELGTLILSDMISSGVLAWKRWPDAHKRIAITAAQDAAMLAIRARTTGQDLAAIAQERRIAQATLLTIQSAGAKQFADEVFVAGSRVIDRLTPLFARFIIGLA